MGHGVILKKVSLCVCDIEESELVGMILKDVSLLVCY